MCRIPSRVGAHFGVLSRLLVVRSRNDQFRLKEDSDSRQPTAICNTADYRFFYCRNGEMGSYCDVTIDVGDPFSPHSPAISGYCRVPSIHLYWPLYLDMYIDRKVFIYSLSICVQVSDEVNGTLSKLSLIPAMEDDGRIVTCRALTPLLAGGFVEDEWRMQVFCKYIQ